MISLTPTEWLANLIGMVGYAMFALSPLARSRVRYIALHGLAMLPITAHYLLLGAHAGAVLSMVYLVADMVSFSRIRLRLALGLVAAGAVAAFALSYQIPADFLGLTGTLIFIASRMVAGHRSTLAVAALSTVTWGAYGLMQNSFSQFAFSLAYALFCLISLWRLSRADV